MNVRLSPLPDTTEFAEAFRTACELDVLAFKPGNVSVESPGHGMQARDFQLSAEAAAPHVTDRTLPLGERIYRAIAATRQAVGCNTNLGIVLLAVPLIRAAQHRLPHESLSQRLRRDLDETTREDTEWVYRAIRLAAPGGLGSSPRHDVHAAPTVNLLSAMREAAQRDRIAGQYASGYADVFRFGVDALRQGRTRWGEETQALTDVYLAYLSGFPDSHVLRKFGAPTAAQVQRMACGCVADMAPCPDWNRARRHLANLDRGLKSAGVNPGTSADLTVATWLADRLLSAAATDPAETSRPAGGQPDI
ncbi:triphosphoribosyl-dephospho-CoA synthase [Thiobacillus sp. 65-1402]|uniref:triphosphoribosyl-dephospho-CoA synthase n=1 Tax=Thiobacillus sp. 65-1402 TaxID=1895861 RepID=UPI00095ABB46|nr:triphosphoribosyl-dephospho-CoA synthase [Thiobacillus sp. 65-1402]OJW85579.1 MAG: hypothetical protein BGO62_11895 [Thiobacillus sp. 65-1402]